MFASDVIMITGGGAAPGYGGGQSYGGQAGKFLHLALTSLKTTVNFIIYLMNLLSTGYGQGYGGGGASYSAPSGGAYGQQPGYSQSMGTNENFGAMSAEVR